MRTHQREAVFSAYPRFTELLPAGVLRCRRYELRFARSLDELDEVLRLRYQVFNVELGEGLEISHETGRDLDEYDAQCHHLLVRDTGDGHVAGTYRLQTSEMAAAGRGFYSADEFDLSRLPARVLDDAVEAGRACVAGSDRNKAVLHLLWRGLALYLSTTGKRWLFGCSSLTSQDPVEGSRMLRHLESIGAIEPRWTVPPRTAYRCEIVPDAGRLPEKVTIPRLFRSYLRVGARVCSPPAIDRRFRTIDFLMLFDAERLDGATRRRFFGDS